jgi:hypothetical protein
MASFRTFVYTFTPIKLGADMFLRWTTKRAEHAFSPRNDTSETTAPKASKASKPETGHFDLDESRVLK